LKLYLKNYKTNHNFLKRRQKILVLALMGVVAILAVVVAMLFADKRLK